CDAPFAVAGFLLRSFAGLVSDAGVVVSCWIANVCCCLGFEFLLFVCGFIFLIPLAVVLALHTCSGVAFCGEVAILGVIWALPVLLAASVLSKFV
ncbi:hypothetical protein Ancab_032233, partial [Ancistrocladus abbreviatus]